MTTNTETVPTSHPARRGAPGHKGEADIARWPDGRWGQACSAPSLPDIPGRDNPEQWEHIQVGWGANTFLTEPVARSSWKYADLVGDLSQYYVREYGIQLDTTGQQDLSIEDARLLAAYLLTAAEQMERASRPFGEAQR